MYTIYFRSNLGKTVSIDLTLLDEACHYWDMLAKNFYMISTRPASL